MNQLQVGQQVEDVFLVTKKKLAETKAGKPFLTLGLMDRTGELDAKIWDNAEYLEKKAEVNDVVQVTATTTEYNGRLQLKVTMVSRVEADQIELAHFMPSSKRPIEEMAKELDEVISAIQDVSLRQLLLEVFQGETREQFLHAPAAKKMHHAYIGGLAEHTLSIVGMAQKTADHYSMLDKDMLVAGALLHDIAKIREFDYSSPAFQYTDRGRLIGHLVMGAEMVRKAAENVNSISPDQLDHLTHMILSHHGQVEFGAAVLPMTPEALLLHHLDDMDAKMNYMEQLREKMDGGEWQWTDYQRPLERFLYLKGMEQDKTKNCDAAPSEPKPKKAKSTPSKKDASKQPSLFGL